MNPNCTLPLAWIERFHETVAASNVKRSPVFEATRAFQIDDTAPGIRNETCQFGIIAAVLFSIFPDP